MSKYKTARTIKEYNIEYNGYNIKIPVNSIVTNSTACGYDDNYRFWKDWEKIAKELTGFEKSGLAHNLEYYGLNIPAEFCTPYPKC